MEMSINQQKEENHLNKIFVELINFVEEMEDVM